jgi:hypothetical protein
MYNHRPTPTHQQPSLANTSATNIPAANTSSVELCSIATDVMSLSNELQNAISAASVVQTSTKTAKKFVFGSLLKEFNLFGTSGVRKPNLDMPTSTDSERVFSVAGNFKKKIKSRVKFRKINTYKTQQHRRKNFFQTFVFIFYSE